MKKQKTYLLGNISLWPLMALTAIDAWMAVTSEAVEKTCRKLGQRDREADFLIQCMDRLRPARENALESGSRLCVSGL